MSDSADACAHGRSRGLLEPTRDRRTPPDQGLIAVIFDDDGELGPEDEPAQEPSRSGRRHASTRRGGSSGRRSGKRRRRGQLITLLAAVVIVALSLTAVVIVRRTLAGFGTPDYTGTGTGSVVVQIQSGDSTADIATILRAKDVVASTDAFSAAARRSGRSTEFQPGFFKLRLQMSGAAAVALLLDPTSRLSTKVTVTEGMIEPQVLTLLSTALHIPSADLKKAAANVKDLGLPKGYAAKSGEGFLFPQTYQYDPGVTAAEALQDMTTQYQAVARQINFVEDARALKQKPYAALIIASMIEAEVRFDSDRAKVARVVYNRLANDIALGFDSTSAYGQKLLGKDPINIDYNKPAPYNTRFTKGLPPTPIGNPGQKAMQAAVHPAVGNWLYFVSRDKAGHLFFTHSKRRFEAAVATCVKRKWGCT